MRIGDIRIIQLTSSSSWSCGVDFQINLILAASSHFMESSFNLIIISSVNPFYQNRAKCWKIKDPGRSR